jgi:hypothetical protein
VIDVVELAGVHCSLRDELGKHFSVFARVLVAQWTVARVVVASNFAYLIRVLDIDVIVELRHHVCVLADLSAVVD